MVRRDHFTRLKRSCAALRAVWVVDAAGSTGRGESPEPQFSANDLPKFRQDDVSNKTNKRIKDLLAGYRIARTPAEPHNWDQGTLAHHPTLSKRSESSLHLYHCIARVAARAFPGRWGLRSSMPDC